MALRWRRVGPFASRAGPVRHGQTLFGASGWSMLPVPAMPGTPGQGQRAYQQSEWTPPCCRQPAPAHVATPRQAFHCAHGRAYLFNTAYNVRAGVQEERPSALPPAVPLPPCADPCPAGALPPPSDDGPARGQRHQLRLLRRHRGLGLRALPVSAAAEPSWAPGAPLTDLKQVEAHEKSQKYKEGKVRGLRRGGTLHCPFDG